MIPQASRRALPLGLAVAALAFASAIAPAAAQNAPDPARPADPYFEWAHGEKLRLEWELLEYDPTDLAGSTRRLGAGALSAQRPTSSSGSTAVRGGPGTRTRTSRWEMELTLDESDSRRELTVELESFGDFPFSSVRSVLDVRAAAATFELGQADDGRVLVLNTVSRLHREKPKAEPLTAEAVGLYRWNFAGAVLYNQEYRGQLGDSGAGIHHVGFPDLGTVDFSLRPFDGAEELGEFVPESRLVVIRTPKGGLLSLQGVTVGRTPLELSGGPFTVWAEWGPPIRTKEESRREVERAIARRGREISPEERARIFDGIERGMMNSHGSGRTTDAMRRGMREGGGR